MPKILVAISAHGFGHLAQISPALNRLTELQPDVELIVQADMPQALIASRINADFEHIAYAADIGILMDGPTVIRWSETIEAHRAYHADWQQQLRTQLDWLDHAKPDLVIGDIPYLTIAAAQAQSIPVVAFCSLNWADILAANSEVEAQLENELQAIRACYQAADVFVQPEPSMPMSWLNNRQEVGPLFRQEPSQREFLNQRLGIAEAEKIVLVSLGGIPISDRVAAWPEISGVHWIVSEKELLTPRADIHSLDALGLSFTTLLASVDLLVTKPGYGSYTEVAGAGIPVISIERSEWAETEVLNAWICQRLAFKQISLQDYLDGAYEDVLLELLSQPNSPPIQPSGIEQAANIFQRLLQTSPSGIK